MLFNEEMSDEARYQKNVELAKIACEAFKLARKENRIKKLKPVRHDDIIEKWHELKVLVESMEVDVLKNAIKCSSTAGIRCRWGFKLLRKKAEELRKLTLHYDKEIYKQRMGENNENND